MTFLSRCALLLSLTALAGCGTKTAEPPRDPNARAGEVTALEGSVTAKRATATTSRALTIDADVFADDEVSTADASMVQIKLAHNGALWTLDASRTQRVDASAAWSAPRRSGSDLVLVRDDREDRTRAAARSGSQEGISTGESALEEADRGRGEPKITRELNALPKPAAAMNAPVPPPEPKPQPTSTMLGGLGISGSGESGGGTSGGDGGIGSIGTLGHGSGTGQGYGEGAGGSDGKRASSSAVTLGVIDVLPADQDVVVKSAIRERWGQIRYCVESTMRTQPDLAGTLTMKLVISADGSVASAVPKSATGIDAVTMSCVAARTKSWIFPRRDGDGVTIATYEIVVKHAGEEPTHAGTPAPGATPSER